MLSPRNLQQVGENLTHEQAAGFLLRLFFLWPAFILVWVSSTTVVGILFDAVFGPGVVFADYGLRIFSLYTLLSYAIGFMAARVWYRSDLVRRRPILGSFMGFGSVIVVGIIVRAITPALTALFG